MLLNALKLVLWFIGIYHWAGPVHTRSMCILLLLMEMLFLCICGLSETGLLQLIEFSAWLIHLSLRVEYWRPLLLLSCFWVPSSPLLIVSVQIYEVQGWVLKWFECQCPPQAQIFEHLIPNWWHCLGIIGVALPEWGQALSVYSLTPHPANSLCFM